MFGLGDWGVTLAFSLVIGTTLICVIYGIINWNKPNKEEEDKEIAEEQNWEKNDPEGGSQ